MGGEAGIEFDSHDMSGSRQERRGDCAAARSDFDNGTPAQIAKGRGDALDGVRVVQEVLSEPGFGGHGLPRW
jgi:hypothetical protein